MALFDLDDEMTLNQSGTIRGQLITAAAIGGRPKDAQPGWPGPAPGAATFGTAAAPLKFVRRDWAIGEVVVPYFLVTPAAASNPTTSMQVDVIASDNPDLATSMTTFNGVAFASAPIVLSTRTVLAAALLAGAIFRMPPLTSGFQRRYLGCKFTPIGGSASTGAYVLGLMSPTASPQESVTSY